VTSKREQVLDAVKALVAAALPDADVKRNLAKADRIPPGGLVIVRDGDPGDPEVMLSPLTYIYTHRIPIEVAAYETSSQPREQVLDEMLGAIGGAVAGDRTLGGAVEWAQPGSPEFQDVEFEGAAAARAALVPFTLWFTVAGSPLA
jgi:hypothetical protein